MRRLQLVLLLLLTAVPSGIWAQASRSGPAAATAAAARRCPNGYRFHTKEEINNNNEVINWTRDQSGLAGVIVFDRTFHCQCARGWGSHVPGWTGPQNLPTTAPNCPFLVVNGANANNCRCFRCPAGHTSSGGLLNSAGSACRRTASPPSQSPPPPTRTAQTAYIRVKFTAQASSNPCAAARTTRMASTLAAGIRNRHRNVRNVTVTVRSCRAIATTARRAGARTAPRQATIDYFIDFTVTFNGQSTDTTSIITTSDNTNTQEGVCTYGICQEITSASGGTIIGADGSPTPIENPPQPSPTPEPEVCADAPPDDTPNSTGWAASCAGTAVGRTCKAPCDTAAGATGVGYTASCNDVDIWEVTGSCTAAPKTCSKVPTATAEITNQTTGWPSTCIGAAIGATCQAPCRSTFAGSGYTVSCTAADTWGTPTGSCTIKTCSGTPSATAPSNTTGWPSSCNNLPIGATCTANCTAAATGSGFLATCGVAQTWTITGSCTAKVCASTPPAASNAAPWNATQCAGKLVGGSCLAACLPTATGPGFVATCTGDNAWNITGSCTPKLCATAPADTLAPNSAGFPDATCANTTVNGRVCTASCNANATGAGYTANCTDTNTWNITGSCTLRSCESAPPAAANGGSWLLANGSACSNVPPGGVCRSNCTFSGTGTPYTATCIAGNWNVTGNCTLKTCTNLPPAALAPLSAGWPNTTNTTAGTTSCLGTVINGTCRTPCASNAAGIGFTATCNDTNTWAVTGSCSVRNCTTQPPFNMTLMSEWSANCSTTVSGANCSATCLPTATGIGYSSVCREGAWLNATGSCVSKTCFQTPPDQTNQAIGWSCPSNATSSTQLGQSCNANCALNSTGPGYTASCTNDADFWPGMNGTVNATTGQVINGSVVPRPNIVFGTWRVTGLCQLRVCPGLPPVPPNALPNWNTSCSNLTAGSNCTLGCAADSTGPGYTAFCLNGNWTVTGACELKQCPTQPPTAINGTSLPNRAQESWNCSATTAGGSCSLPCTNIATGMYIATCTNDANWTISGGCPLKTCTGLPADRAFAEDWPNSCANATHGTICTASCWGNSTGTWQALCDAGNWTITTPATAGCRLQTCPSLPPAQNLTLAWNANCSNSVHGSICEANCTANATGLARAQCNNGSWVISQDTTCTLRNCSDVPVTQLNANNFSAVCANLIHGQTCNALCRDNAFGAWTATCDANTGWVYSGGCPIKRCAGLPPLQPNAGPWNASIANSTVGTNFSIPCTANITVGSGYSASCGYDAVNLTSYGNWSVSGSCSLKRCPGLPAAMPYTSDWPESCTNASHGVVCNTTCDQQGIGRAEVRCEAGVWQAPQLVCAPKRCATLPPVQPFAESSSWNVSFRNASVNTVMSIGCLPNITDGAGYTATCVENTAAPSANWTVNGSCTLKVCAGLPEFQINSAGWPDSCANRTHGFVCNGTCAGNSTGRILAQCVAGNWQVNATATCALRRCIGLPTESPPDLSNGWNASCENATHGSSCTAPCDATAFGGYSARCFEGAWVISNATNATCQLKRCPGLPPTRELVSGTWAAAFENATVGAATSLNCSSNNTEGGGFTATCQNTDGLTGNWSVTGDGCRLRKCPGSPAPELALLSAGWLSSCVNKTAFENCTALCNSTIATGSGYLAVCNEGNYEVTGSCTIRRCSAAPTLASANSADWDSACANVTFGSECRAICASNSFGDGYSARCNGTNKWDYSGSGNCTVKACQGVPTTPANSNNIPMFGSAWYTMDGGSKVPCNGNLLNANCTADCAASMDGPGFKAECKPVPGGANAWVTWGSCTEMKCGAAPVLDFQTATPQTVADWKLSTQTTLNCPNPASPGTICKAACNEPFSSGSGFNLECRLGQWGSWGTCNVSMCAGSPPVPANSRGWGVNGCNNTAVGLSCTAQCDPALSTATAPVVAECRRQADGSNAYEVTGSCPIKSCPDVPTKETPDSTGWEAACAGKTVLQQCRAPCATKAFGTGYTATCVDQALWNTTAGSCIGKCLETELPAVIEGSVGWIQGCVNTPRGQKCTAPCDSSRGFVGGGYTITCGTSLDWDYDNIGGTGCTSR